MAPNKKLNPSENFVETDLRKPTLVERLWWFSSVGFAGDFLDWFLRWRQTRNWRRVLVAAPALAIASGLSITVLVGKLWSDDKKRTWYIARAEEQVKELESHSAALDDAKSKTNIDSRQNLSDESANAKEAEVAKANEDALRQGKLDFIDLLYKRVLQLEQNNRLAKFHVASQMSRYGKIAPAHAMMSDIAPDHSKGLDLAHAWLASDMIRSAQNGEPVDITLLKHHLKYATSMESVPPGLLLLYSQLLQQENNIEEASKVLKRAAASDSRLQLNAAAVFAQRGLMEQAKLAADTLIEEYSKRRDDDVNEDNRMSIARAYAITNRIDEATTTLEKAVRKYPSSAMLRRGLSDALRTKFRRSIRSDNGRLSLNIDLLNGAIAADPANVDVRQELELIKSFGIGVSDTSLQSLRNQMAINGTSYALRLLLAEAAYVRGEIKSAVDQYELLLAELPNMTLAMNNMAIMLTQLTPSRNDDALALIETALKLNPTASEFYDSRGSILIACNREADAVQSYIKALELEPTRIGTYTSLIELYRKMGETAQVEAWNARLDQAKQFVEKQRSQLEQAKRLNSINALPAEQPSSGSK